MEGMVLVYGALCEGQDEEKDDAKRLKNLTYYRIHDLPEYLCQLSDHQVRGNAEKKWLLKLQTLPSSRFPCISKSSKIKPFSLSCLISVKTYRQNGGPHSILRWKKQKYARRRSFC